MSKLLRASLLLNGLLILSFFVSQPAIAVTYSFECIALDVPGDCAIGEGQIELDVTDAGAGQVRFKFSNLDPPGAQSTVQALYWDDLNGLLDAIDSFTGSPVGDVNFAAPASPPVLPGGNGNPYFFDVDFSADANNPAPTNGVNPDEMVAVIFDLSSGVSFADLIAEIGGEPLDGSKLRVGIHVTNFASGGSESFMSVPEPASAALVSLGLLGLTVARASRFRPRR